MKKTSGETKYLLDENELREAVYAWLSDRGDIDEFKEPMESFVFDGTEDMNYSIRFRFKSQPIAEEDTR